MKKLIYILAFMLILFALSFPSFAVNEDSEDYIAGYEDGYIDGEKEAEFYYDSHYEAGYEAGYEEAEMAHENDYIDGYNDAEKDFENEKSKIKSTEITIVVVFCLLAIVLICLVK